MRWWMCFLVLPIYGMDVEKGVIPLSQEEEFFSEKAIEVFTKNTSIDPSPSVKPYVIRLVSYSRHNGDADRFVQMKQEIKEEDEEYLNKLVSRAMNMAIKDQEEEIERRITIKKAGFAVALGSFLASALSAGIALAAALSHHCK